MTSSPPASPIQPPQRPLSAIARPQPRSSSRMSMSSKVGGSRASDDEARTAVKVAVRVRPPLEPSDPGFDLIPQRFRRSMVQTTTNTSLSIDSPQGRKVFVFDRVFGADVLQDGIWDYLSDSINAFTQGYNVSILAYGQSGAGKSFTMGTSGPSEQMDVDLMGVIPRAATALFEKLDVSSVNGSGAPKSHNSLSQLRTPRGYGAQNALGDRSWSLKATYVEIYNEHLRDLLVPDSTPAHERNNVAIREDVKGNIILTGLRQVEINSAEDLMNALNFGSAIRQTDSTAINAKSSRSHAVFSLNLIQRKSRLQTAQGSEKRFSVPLEAMTGQDVTVTTDSKLHFVDLAGSERLKNTGAQGERAKEGISINAGLASLGKVISQLSSRQSGSHVSYRDSKLTRLLQDSLGGNAITYMIACVTPAEFHLSETLNTVQYAQRARAIQSKPRIQQIEEGDKQAVIDRLKVEVAFLREQIRSAQEHPSSPYRNGNGPNERAERQNEREVELQNQLLDTQENYSALSRRHARLISEMAKARENESSEADASALAAQEESATDRLNRSNSFAQAVEQVVLEYEKTIQSLEQSLSSTRTTLSNTETNLLEKESKCAFVETINTQLQSRVQKLMDREASTENYLHDLETKLDGHTSGEEKNSAIIVELRKEIVRVRENEASCEDYISTLEERLAEADQDTELMQREIDRLEQVVERQRSLGKLDSLLHELDHVEDSQQPPEPEALNGLIRRRNFEDHSRSHSHASRPSQVDKAIPEVNEDEDEDVPPIEADIVPEEATHDANIVETAEAEEDDKIQQTPAQSKYVADKLETVTQELLDLRVDHETTVNNFDALNVKYEEALQKLAQLQDAVDEARHSGRTRDSVVSAVASPLTDARPESFMSESKSSDLHDGPRSSLAKSLSSELSSAIDSTATGDTSTVDAVVEDDVATTKPAASMESLSESQNEELAAELERLKALAQEKETAEHDLAQKYAELESKHSETLDIVEELKTEVSKARAVEVNSHRQSTPVIRRKSSQNLMVIDRAHRSFTSLRNIAGDNFEDKPEVMANFELNINSIVHELHARSARIQELEADITSAKREMETKMTIITGLTRERSSMTANPRDMSMVASMREQLERNERELSTMRQAHASREQELSEQLDSLRADIQQPSNEVAAIDNEELKREHAEKVSSLQTELATWEEKHQKALAAMNSTEQDMRLTIKQLESEVATVNAKLAETSNTSSATEDPAVREAEEKHRELVGMLRGEIDEYKAIINSNAAKVAELESSHAATKTELDNLTREHSSAKSDFDNITQAHSTIKAELDSTLKSHLSAKTELEEMAKSHSAAMEESTRQNELILRLEEQIAAHEQATKTHQDGLALLKENHAKELSELRMTEQKSYEEQVEVLMSEHSDSVHKLEAELSEARDSLLRVSTQVAQALGVESSVDMLSERIDTLLSDQRALADERTKMGEVSAKVTELTSINESVLRDLESTKTSLAEMLSDGSSHNADAPITDHLTAVKSKLADLENRNKKNSRLVEELEEQLQNNFDEAQMTSNRLSTLQTERHAQLEEALTARARLQAELDTIREEHTSLQSKYNEATVNGEVKRSNSNSTIRKSSSHTSLPSPPPAIPLPPLPSSASGNSTTNGLPTSPTTIRPASKDNMNISQITEDQEARIRTIEKHLYAERQLTQTLEEALTDLENQSKKVKTDCDAWRKRTQELESEVKELKDRPMESQVDNRWSMHAVEEERKKRQAAEAARKQLEERMNAINKGKKKKGSLNCF